MKRWKMVLDEIRMLAGERLIWFGWLMMPAGHEHTATWTAAVYCALNELIDRHTPRKDSGMGRIGAADLFVFGMIFCMFVWIIMMVLQHRQEESGKMGCSARGGVPIVINGDMVCFKKDMFI